MERGGGRGKGWGKGKGEGARGGRSRGGRLLLESAVKLIQLVSKENVIRGPRGFWFVVGNLF